jgi:hypothetical protein
MTLATITQLATLQEDDGSFPSEVTGPGGTFTDRNGFTTASVLRALRGLPAGDPTLDQLRSRALGFVVRCRSRTVAGAFGFWPAGMRPEWADRLPDDIDDTAIMTVELLRHGRLSQRDALRTVCTVLLRHRLVARPEELRPPWIADGAFLTWIAQPGQPNVVDCCVNANAAALMARVGATHLPGYREATRTIVDGLDWAGSDAARLRSLTPFYPSTNDLLTAVEHAVECGANALAPALERLRELRHPDDDACRDYCSSAYGTTIWRCQALEVAQRLHDRTVARNRSPSRDNRARRTLCRSMDTPTSTARSLSSAGESTTPMGVDHSC